MIHSWREALFCTMCISSINRSRNTGGILLICLSSQW